MKINKPVFAGAMAICVAAILWGLDGIVLTPQLYRQDITLVVFVLHALPFILMNFLFFREYRHLRNFTSGDVLMFFFTFPFWRSHRNPGDCKSLVPGQFQGSDGCRAASEITASICHYAGCFAVKGKNEAELCPLVSTGHSSRVFSDFWFAYP